MSLMTQSVSRQRPHQFMGEMLWPVLLAVAAVGGSLAFACITPFAAFAALAAETQRPRAALGTLALIWAANQAVGFAFLGYPRDASTLLWGVGILVAALLATGAACFVVARLNHVQRWQRLALAFAAAFVVYQLVLLAPGVASGEGANFTPAMMVNYARLDGAWLAGLVALHEILAWLGWPNLSSLRQPA
jgi:hypothetical protein